MAARRDETWGGVWIVDFVMSFPDGTKTRIREKSPEQNQRGATSYEQHLRVQKMLEWQRRQYVPMVAPRKEVPTLAEFADEFVATYARANNKPSEVQSKSAILRLYLVPALGALRLDEVKKRQVERLKAELLDRELSPKTVNNALAVLSTLLRYAEEAEVIELAPRLRRLKVAEPDFDFLDFDEGDRLLVAAGNHSPEWHAMVFTALRTGLRYGELCELRWGDVDLVAGRLMVWRSFTKGHVTTPKNGKVREVPLSPQTIDLLRRHRHLRGELVFSKPDGGRHIHRRADVALKRICRRAGLRAIGWHTLRHSFASQLAMRGVPLRTVQELLGHRDIRQTLRYAHVAPEVAREAVSTLDGVSEDAKSWQYRGSSHSAAGN